MRRNAPLEEIQFRKRAYDEAYVDWNKNILLNLFAIREVGGDLKFADARARSRTTSSAPWPTSTAA